MFLTFKKWSAVYALSLLALLLIFTAILRQGSALQVSAPAEEAGREVVFIIDPGHGGEDGGAVAADGTVESAVNLAVALKMEEAAKLLGLDSTMTRREDVSIHDAGASTLRQKKVSDLKNRVALCNGTEGGVLISIHQNSLPQSPRVSGAQVFYNGQTGSEELARAIQDALNDVVNTGAPKSPKAIGSGVYLMANTDCPAVLVECGFLSNPEETQLLKDPGYQKKLAVVILSAAAEHLMGGGQENAGQNRTNVVY